MRVRVYKTVYGEHFLISAQTPIPTRTYFLKYKLSEELENILVYTPGDHNSWLYRELKIDEKYFIR